MKGKVILLVFCFVFGLGCFGVCGQKFENVKLSIRESENKVQTLWVAFEIFTQYLEGEKNRTYGNLLFKKPNKLRLKYVKPNKLSYISNGTTLWIYNPLAKQVMIKNFGKISDKNFGDILSFFSLDKLEADYKYTAYWEQDSYYVITLESKDESQGIKLTMYFDKKTLYPNRIMIEKDEMRTLIKMKNFITNKKVKDAKFEFEIPKNVEVLDMRT